MKEWLISLYYMDAYLIIMVAVNWPLYATLCFYNLPFTARQSESIQSQPNKDSPFWPEEKAELLKPFAVLPNDQG